MSQKFWSFPSCFCVIFFFFLVYSMVFLMASMPFQTGLAGLEVVAAPAEVSGTGAALLRACGPHYEKHLQARHGKGCRVFNFKRFSFNFIFQSSVFYFGNPEIDWLLSVITYEAVLVFFGDLNHKMRSNAIAQRQRHLFKRNAQKSISPSISPTNCSLRHTWLLRCSGSWRSWHKYQSKLAKRCKSFAGGWARSLNWPPHVHIYTQPVKDATNENSVCIFAFPGPRTTEVCWKAFAALCGGILEGSRGGWQTGQVTEIIWVPFPSSPRC